MQALLTSLGQARGLQEYSVVAACISICLQSATGLLLLWQASKDLPKVKKMLEQAEAVLGYDILQLCLEGPREKLDDTAFSQPALYIAGLAAAEMLQHDDPDAFHSCSATAGVSPAALPTHHHSAQCKLCVALYSANAALSCDD